MKFKFLATLAAFLITTSAHADLPLGVYHGKTLSGETCSFEVIAVGFAEGLKHPLAELVYFKYLGTEYVLKHPAKVDVAKGKVRPDGSLLVSTQPLDQGATAIALSMVHSSEFHGPSELSVINDNYVDPTKSTILKCQNLVPPAL